MVKRRLLCGPSIRVVNEIRSTSKVKSPVQSRTREGDKPKMEESIHTVYINQAFSNDLNHEKIKNDNIPSTTPVLPPPYHSLDKVQMALDGKMDGEISNSIDPRRLSVTDLAPHIDHYRNIISVRKQGENKQGHRPSLAELHLRIDDLPEPRGGIHEHIGVPTVQKSKPIKEPVKFGWITGVLVRCILSILGAVLYLRLSWITGQAGVALATLIVFLSYIVTTLTAISMCAISTNGEIRGGGAYYMLSRSLGPEFGGSMGVMFALANAFAAALHTVGFAETVRDLLKSHDISIVDGGRNDIRILGVATLILLAAIVIVGIDFESKAQFGLLVILAISYVNYVIGTFLPVSEYKKARGVTGYSWKTFTSNIPPNWAGEDFYSVFGVYFPSATGIMAGANISGDLKEPGKAIPKGTLLALLVTFIMYLGAILLPAATCVREASGEIDWLNGTEIGCSGNGTCQYGLLNQFQVIELESAFGPLITAGIFAATLSSALVCLVSSPKLLQAVGRDNLFPALAHLSKGYGRNDEPRRAYFLTFFISLVMVFVGDLNSIAPFISNFYLATYTLVNYACFDCSLAKSPGWRPAFRYYNKWLSLLGAVLCVTAMFLMSWWSALLTIVFVLCLYVYILRSKPDVNWGSSSQARTYNVALQGMLKLLITEDHVKNYRPQILALSGNPIGRAAFVDFVRNITGHKSLLILGHFVKGKPSATMYNGLKNWTASIYPWLRKRSVKAFFIPIASANKHEGFQSMLQICGLGKLRPNIVMMGFKNNWKSCSSEEIDDYFQLIHEAFDCQMSVGVLRVRDGLDYMNVMREHDVCDAQNYSNLPEIRTPSPITRNPINDPNDRGDKNEPGVKPRKSRRKPFSIYTLGTETVKALAATVENFDLSLLNTSQSQRQVLASVNQFQTKVKKGVVDVWWLADDGGLTLLIPYILTHHRSYLNGAKLRIFTGSSGKQTIEHEQKSITALLQKFRIDFSDVCVLTDLNMDPKLSTINEFNEMIAPFKTDAGQRRSPNIYITDAELEVMKDRTYRHLRIRDLLLNYSKDASLTVVSMPVPRRGGVSACLYLAWLDMLVKDLSPVLLIRGNQQPVLTFYS